MEKSSQNALFIADLNGIELTPEQRAEIDRGVKQAVMRTLAQIDQRGDLVINRAVAKNPKFLEFGPEILGIWIDDFDINIRRRLGHLNDLTNR